MANRPFKPSKESRAEFVRERERMQRQNRRLAERGLPTLNIPKLRELTSAAEMRKFVKKIAEFRESGRAFVKTARAIEEARKQEEARKREERKARERERRREYYRKRKREQEELDNYLEENEHARFMADYFEELDYKIKSVAEMKQWFAYLNKRNAMRSRKAFYEFDRYVDQFQQLKEKGYTKPHKFEEMMKDFDAFVSDEKQMKERMQTMSLKYGASLIDQIYSDWIQKLEEKEEQKAAREQKRKDRKKK